MSSVGPNAQMRSTKKLGEPNESSLSEKRREQCKVSFKKQDIHSYINEQKQV